MLGQVRAKNRPRHGREREYGGKIALEATAFAGWNVFSNQRLRECHQAAATEALHGARDDKR